MSTETPQTLLLDSLEIRNFQIEKFGIVVDADLSLESRWESLRSLLLKAGYTDISKKPAPDGTIIRQKVAEWLVSLVELAETSP